MLKNLFKRKHNQIENQKQLSFNDLIGVYTTNFIYTPNYDKIYREGYAQNPIVRACVDRIARGCSQIELKLFKTVKGKKLEIKEHPILNLLKNPNAFLSGSDFIRDMISYKLLAGNIFILADNLAKDTKQISELFLPNPNDVSIKLNENGLPYIYICKIQNGNQVNYPISIKGKSQMLHIKDFSPDKMFLGSSRLMSAAIAVDTTNACGSFNYNMLQNGLRPSGALIVENGAALTEKQHARLKEELKDTYAGAGNAGKPLIFEGGLKWQEMSLNPKDMEFKENLLISARLVAGVFGVPPQLVNIPGESTYNNYAEAKEAFWIDTIIPEMQSIVEGFNKWLCPRYDESLTLEINEDAIDALSYRRARKLEQLNQNRFMTINEKRLAGGLDAVNEKNANTLLVESGLTPINELSFSENTQDLNIIDSQTNGI